MWHDRSDSLDQLKRDVRVGDNPQHQDNPQSVIDSAKRELRRRGYSEQEITNMSHR